jgi:tetratricopeptide (TPR) repeat protein
LLWGKVTVKKRHWLDIAEYTSLAGLGVGAVASHLSTQLIYTSAPLSLVLLFNLLNRRRLDQLTEQNANTAIQNLDQKLSNNIQMLDKHIKDLPLPEDLAAVKKSLLSRNREVLEKLSQDIAAVQAEIKERLVPLEQQDPGALRQEVSQLREQYRQLGESLMFVNARLQDISNTEEIEVLNKAIAQIKADAAQLRTNLQALSEQTKPTLTSLQDQITHLNRQFQKLPPPFDSTALKQEVSELTRIAADLVPKRDWSNLVTELRTLQQQQESQVKNEENLRRKLQDLSQDLQSRPVKANLASLQNQINYLSSQIQKLPPPFDPTTLKQEITELIQTVAERTPRGDWTALENQIKALQKQQEFQTQVEAALKRELQDISRQLSAFVRGETTTPPGSIHAVRQMARQGAEATETVLPQREFQMRLEAALREELQEVEQQLQELPDSPELQTQVEATVSRELLEINRHLHSYPTEPQYELVFDFRNGSPAIAQENPASSRRVLLEALEHTQERLLLIWPWSSQCPLDNDLLQRLETFLQAGKRLDLGWCHQVGREDRFLSVINQRWGIQLRQRELQETLQKLLQLKQAYPEQFWFQVLGTAENFLVADRDFAVLGTDESLTSHTLFPNLELKLRTTDASVIQQLIQRFDHPTLHSNDVQSHWNRAVTRYDLGDRQGALEDLNHVLAVMVNDVVAYNYRGLVRYDLGDRQGAITDFNRALNLNPNYGTALCNRGFVLSELGDQLGAIADFSLAIQNQPDFAIAYFYRGVAGQKFGDLPGALTDYSEAIRLVPDSAPCYYYRGLTRQKLDDVRGAIADLWLAEALFTEWGNRVNAQKARKYLDLLSQTVPLEELAAIETAQADILEQVQADVTSEEPEAAPSGELATDIPAQAESEETDTSVATVPQDTWQPDTAQTNLWAGFDPDEDTETPPLGEAEQVSADSEPLGDDDITALLTESSAPSATPMVPEPTPDSIPKQEPPLASDAIAMPAVPTEEVIASDVPVNDEADAGDDTQPFNLELLGDWDDEDEDDDEPTAILIPEPKQPETLDEAIAEPTGDSAEPEPEEQPEEQDEEPFTLEMIDNWGDGDTPSAPPPTSTDPDIYGDMAYSETVTQANLPAPANGGPEPNGTETLSSFFSDIPLFAPDPKPDSEELDSNDFALEDFLAENSVADDLTAEEFAPERASEPDSEMTARDAELDSGDWGDVGEDVTSFTDQASDPLETDIGETAPTLKDSELPPSDLDISDLFADLAPEESAPEVPDQESAAPTGDQLPENTATTEEDTIIALPPIEPEANGNGFYDTSDLIELLWESPFEDESASQPDQTPASNLNQLSTETTADDHDKRADANHHTHNHHAKSSDSTETMESFFAEVDAPVVDESGINPIPVDHSAASRSDSAEPSRQLEPKTLSDFLDHF